MENKVILISVDGMRPDGFLNCGNPYIHKLMENAYFSLNARTVFPSVTLPCHMSLFHSVPPERHGITANAFMPQVRPVSGLFEQVSAAGGVCAMYYGWEPLRDVARPGSLKYSEYVNAYLTDSADTELTDSALKRIKKDHPDFVFLYMVDTDERGGHEYGWMSVGYLDRISTAMDNIRRVIESCADEYSIIITADHGGHDRCHGTNMEEDMVIPFFFLGRDFPKGFRFEGGSILSIAPTIAKIMGIPPAREWEGVALI